MLNRFNTWQCNCSFPHNFFVTCRCQVGFAQNKSESFPPVRLGPLSVRFYLHHRKRCGREWRRQESLIFSGMRYNYFDLSAHWLCSLFPFLYPVGRDHRDKAAGQDSTWYETCTGQNDRGFHDLVPVFHMQTKTKRATWKLNATSLDRFFKYWPGVQKCNFKICIRYPIAKNKKTTAHGKGIDRLDCARIAIAEGLFKP